MPEQLQKIHIFCRFAAIGLVALAMAACQEQSKTVLAIEPTSTTSVSSPSVSKAPTARATATIAPSSTVVATETQKATEVPTATQQPTKEQQGLPNTESRYYHPLFFETYTGKVGKINFPMMIGLDKSVTDRPLEKITEFELIDPIGLDEIAKVFMHPHSTSSNHKK